MNEFIQAFRGCMVVAGPSGTGKTTLALSMTNEGPERILYLNFDVKRLMVDGVTQVAYQHLMHPQTKPVEATGEEAKGLEIAMVKQFERDVASIEPGKYDLIVVDGWQVYGRAIQTLVELEWINLRESPKAWAASGQGTMGAMAIKGFGKHLQGRTVDLILEKAPRVVLVYQADPMYEKNQKVEGRYAANIVANVQRAMTTAFWLYESADGHTGTPIALTLKPMGRPTLVKGKGFQNPVVFPPKLSPQAIDRTGDGEFVSLVDIMDHYWKHPFGLQRDMHDYEELTDEERHMIEMSLTEQQREVLKARMEGGLALFVRQLVRGEVPDLGEVKVPPMVLKEVKKQYPKAHPDMVISILTDVLEELG